MESVEIGTLYYSAAGGQADKQAGIVGRLAGYTDTPAYVRT
jgi:hypothetical protein